MDAELETYLKQGHIYNKLYKIYYFVPHEPQDLNQASYFGWYTPGLLTTCEILRSCAQYPSDIREILTDYKTKLRLRLSRLLWLHVTPVDIDALEYISGLDSSTFFRIIFSNNPRMAKRIDKLSFKDNIPFLHVSSIEGENRVDHEAFDDSDILAYVNSVFDQLDNIEEYRPFVEFARGSLEADDREEPKKIELPMSFHNLTTPNEESLAAYGRKLYVEDPLSPDDPAKYLGRVLDSAEEVYKLRSELLGEERERMCKNSYLVALSSVYWGQYGGKFKIPSVFEGKGQKEARAVINNIIKQETYVSNIHIQDEEKFRNGSHIKALIMMRSADQRCFTAGLTLLAASSLTPVIRLEPRLNQIRGHLTMLAHSVRGGSQEKKPYKVARMMRQLSNKMEALVDKGFLDRLQEEGFDKNIKGIQLVSDMPLEHIPIGNLPLGLRFDVSRIPVTPGNLYFMHCVSPPIFLSPQKLMDILVLRSFDAGDSLRNILYRALESTQKQIDAEIYNVRFRDVTTEEELIEALNSFSGGILIFDGHGSYKGEYGIGTLVLGSKPVDIWELKDKCQMPPIVIFSACDTHPIDGSHGSVANSVFTLGAKAVLATTLPILGPYAASFIGRLILRLYEFVPLVVKNKRSISWREVISGLLRMTYTTEVLISACNNGNIRLTQETYGNIQLAANIAINKRENDWFEVFMAKFSSETGISREELNVLVQRWSPMVESLKYVNLGAPEDIIISDDPYLIN